MYNWNLREKGIRKNETEATFEEIKAENVPRLMEETNLCI